MNIPTELAEVKTTVVTDVDGVESKFVTLWNSYKPQVAAAIAVAFALGFVLGHLGRHIVHVAP